jgi:hypothetical protein
MRVGSPLLSPTFDSLANKLQVAETVKKLVGYAKN